MGSCDCFFAQSNAFFAALDDILESNGWELHHLNEHTTEIHTVQMFLSSYNRVSCLHLFPSLKRVQVIGQNVDCIQGLDSCTSLESLWIVEGDITFISGLEVVTSLTKLCLYGNSIAHIANLNHLRQLRVLWLADNHICDLAGLEELCSLQELNVARNPIQCVPQSLCLNTCLRTLNLADTVILSFTAITPLAMLPSLRELFFDDPSWGRTPIADLSNYQTMVIVQLPQLTVLDYLLISDDASELAQSTFAKKRMFYNMRTKGCMRIMHEAEELARAGMCAQQRSWHAQIEEAVRTRSRLEYMLRHYQELQQCHQDESELQKEGEAKGNISKTYARKAVMKLKALKAVEYVVASRCSEIEVR